MGKYLEKLKARISDIFLTSYESDELNERTTQHNSNGLEMITKEASQLSAGREQGTSFVSPTDESSMFQSLPSLNSFNSYSEQGKNSSDDIQSLESDQNQTIARSKLSGHLEVGIPNTGTNRVILERLPWELERLVSAASNGILPSGSFKLESGTVPDLERYVLAWTGAYILGDTVQALSRLWEAQKVWTHSRNLN